MGKDGKQSKTFKRLMREKKKEKKEKKQYMKLFPKALCQVGAPDRISECNSCFLEAGEQKNKGGIVKCAEQFIATKFQGCVDKMKSPPPVQLVKSLGPKKAIKMKRKEALTCLGRELVRYVISNECPPT